MEEFKPPSIITFVKLYNHWRKASHLNLICNYSCHLTLNIKVFWIVEHHDSSRGTMLPVSTLHLTSGGWAQAHFWFAMSLIPVVGLDYHVVENDADYTQCKAILRLLIGRGEGILKCSCWGSVWENCRKWPRHRFSSPSDPLSLARTHTHTNLHKHIHTNTHTNTNMHTITRTQTNANTKQQNS